MKISEVSKIFGIPQATLRFIEEQGIVKPSRDRGNNYREYDMTDITVLLEYLKYRHIGLPIEIIRSYLRSGEHSLLTEGLQACEEEQERKIVEIQMLLETVKTYKKKLETLEENIGMYWFEKSPPQRCICIGKTTKERKWAIHSEEEARWRQHVPYVSLMCMLDGEELEKDDWEVGWYLMCQERDAKRLGIKAWDEVETLPEQMCLSTYAKVKGEQDIRDCFLPCLQFLRDRGREPAGRVMAQYLKVGYCGEEIESCYQLYIPVKGKTL